MRLIQYLKSKKAICLILAIAVSVSLPGVLVIPGKPVLSAEGSGQIALESRPTSSPSRDYQEGVYVPPGQPAPAVSTLAGEIRAKGQVVMASKATARIKQIKGEVGDFIKKGDVVVEMDHDVLDAQVKQAEAALAVAEAQLAKMQGGPRKEQVAIAKANFVAAQAALDLLLEGARKEQVAAAQAALKAAQSQLDLLIAGPTADQLYIAELQVRIAEAQETLRAKTQEASMNTRSTQTGMQPYSGEMAWFQEIVGQLQVQLAQAQLKVTKSPPRPELQSQAQAAVDAARAQLDLLTASPRTQQIAQLESAVEIARQGLELATSPYTSYDLDTASAGVAQASAALQAARALRDETLLIAPFDGLIALRSLDVGALAMAGVPIAVFVSTELEMVFSVAEPDFAQVRVGQMLAFGVSAYPGQIMSGSIRAIAPAADSASRSFLVYVTITDPEGRLRPGMFATISLLPM